MLPETIKSCRVLIVDDEPAMLESLRRMLVSCGHSVKATSDPREALALFENGRFDLVILDYEMPDIKGDELALIIKSLVPGQPIAMITAYPGTLAAQLLTEVDVIIQKPFNLEDFCQAVNRFWSRTDPLVIKQTETEYFRRALTQTPPVPQETVVFPQQNGSDAQR